MLQCVAVRCSALQCVAVRCSALQSVAECETRRLDRSHSVAVCAAVRCSVCCSVLQCVHCVAVCFSELYLLASATDLQCVLHCVLHCVLQCGVVHAGGMNELDHSGFDIERRVNASIH